MVDLDIVLVFACVEDLLNKTQCTQDKATKNYYEGKCQKNRFLCTRCVISRLGVGFDGKK